MVNAPAPIAPELAYEEDQVCTEMHLKTILLRNLSHALVQERTKFIKTSCGPVGQIMDVSNSLAEEKIRWSQSCRGRRFCAQRLQAGDGFLPTGAGRSPRGPGQAEEHERADEAAGRLLRADGQDRRAHAEGELKSVFEFRGI